MTLQELLKKFSTECAINVAAIWQYGYNAGFEDGTNLKEEDETSRKTTRNK